MTIGVVLRFVTISHLWLDEALSVNISRLPLSQIPDALRHDGSPPLYYVLLHLWISLFGAGDSAVRALSGLFAVASLPLAWLAGRKIGGRTTAWAVLLLMATSPFAIRYGTETRMYSLLGFLVLAGFLVLMRLFERPSRWTALALSVLSGMLLLTHYWSVFLVGVLGLLLLLRLRRTRDRGSRLAVVAVASSPLFLIPWLPVFLFQMAHTGTPWAQRPLPDVVVATISEWAGGGSPTGPALFLVLVALLVLALMGTPTGRRRIELDVRTRPGVRAICACCFGVLLVALILGAATGSAFVVRYTSVVFPLFMLAVGFGALALGDSDVRHAVLALAAVLGLVAAAPNVDSTRTQAGVVASALHHRAAPGSVIVYCPDQLGPSVSRLLPDVYTQLTYPSGGRPERVDWVDYAKRNDAARSAPFAQRVVDQAAGRDIFVVWSLNYRTYGHRCQGLTASLERLRPRMLRRVTISTTFFERMGLIEFQPR